MKKKYLAGILTATLVAGILGGCGSQGAQNAGAEVPAESQVAQVAEPVESQAEAESAVPESQVAEPTEEPKPDYSAAYAAYLDVLQKNEPFILSYNWQRADLDNTEPVPRPVTFEDVYGDETPELLFMRETDDEDTQYHFKASLVVDTYEDGNIKTLYNEPLDLAVAGGTCFCVFVGKDKTLYIYDSIGDEGVEYHYTRLNASGGALTPAQKLSHSCYPNDDYTAFVDTYYIDEVEVPHEDYEKIRSAWFDNADKILLTSANDDDFLINFEREHGSEALAYADATSALQGLIPGSAPVTDSTSDSAAPANLNAEDIFRSLNGEKFGFASGVGAWSSEFKFAGDGIFMGSFHDSDMGDTGDGYPNGTVYESDFSGRFEIANIINDHSVTLRLAECGTSEQVGKEWIYDEIRYVASEPYGIEGGEEFILYLPGTPMSELTDEGRQWYQMPRALSDEELPPILPCYGLYNVNEGTAFFSFE